MPRFGRELTDELAFEVGVEDTGESQEVRIKVEKDVEDLLKQNPDLF